jgi:hypothetical protein
MIPANAATLGGCRHHGGDALFDKVDVLDGRIRFDEAGAHWQGNRLKLRFKEAEVVSRERQQQTIANNSRLSAAEDVRVRGLVAHHEKLCMLSEVARRTN